MAITSDSQLIAALKTAAQRPTLIKTMPAGATTLVTSLWAQSGRPAAGTVPSTPGAVPTNSTAGAIPFTNPTGGRETNLARAFGWSTVPGTLIIFDRLVHCSFSGTTTTAQTLNTVPVNRPANGAGEMWIEYVNQVTGAANVVVGFTNGSGSTVTSTSSPVPLGAAGTMVPILDTLARSVQSVDLDVTSGATTLAITILRRLAEIPVPAANIGSLLNVFDVGFADVYDSSCLMLAFAPGNTSSGQVHGSVTLVQG